MNNNIYATCVNLKSKGILILGDSGSGKSDLALRLITEFSAKLVSDDRTEILAGKEKPIATAPKILKGLLEVRGIGIIKTEAVDETVVDVVIQLTSDKIDRMPEKKYYQLEGFDIPLYYINPFEISATSKIITILSLL